MTSKDKKSYEDTTRHHLLQIKEPGDALVFLRLELSKPQNADIFKWASKGNSFEECCGIIAAHLDIVLDGMYDGDELCLLLAECLHNRHSLKSKNQPHLLHPSLMNVELVERDNDVTVEIVEEEVNMIVPPVEPNPVYEVSEEEKDELVATLETEDGNKVAVKHCYTCNGTGFVYDGETLTYVLGQDETKFVYDSETLHYKLCPDCNGDGFIVDSTDSTEEKKGE